jgi:hypothetical protein
LDRGSDRILQTARRSQPGTTLAEAFLQLLASGLGTLALVWATVVLLGGYSTMLVRLDFWFTTAIVFVETAR